MKKILVPIDFSENTTHVIHVACNFAQQHQCSIILLHSYFDLALLQSINTITPNDVMPVMEPNYDFLRESCEEQMNRISSKIDGEYPSLQIETMVTGLDLEETIGEVCSKKDVLMIFIGATGTGKKESFSGSTASSLFSYSPVPVLAIPEGYQYKGGNLNNVLYATNFAEAAQSEVQFIIDYFIRGSNILLCRNLRFPENDTLLDNAQMEVLKKPFDKEIQKGIVTFDIIDTNDVEKTLEDLVEKNDIGVISFHEHNRSIFQQLFHKAVVKKNLYRFNIPLLVFRWFNH